MKNMSEICVVSWDLDGTLYSMDAMKTQIIRQLMGSVTRGVSGMTEAVTFLRLNHKMSQLRGNPIAVSSFLKGPKGQRFLALQAEWISKALVHCDPNPGVPALIEQCRSRGLRQVICTDYPIGQKLERLGLVSGWDAHIVASDTYHLKPDRAVFERLCSMLEVSPHQVLHIGDRMDTDGGAAAAGLSTLILGHDVQDIFELASVVESICR